MKINFYNTDIQGKRMNQHHHQITKFMEENQHLDFEQRYNMIKEKFNYTQPQNGFVSINTKTIALLKLTKEEIKSLALKEENYQYIYNKDFKKIIQRIKKYNKNKKNKELLEFELFFYFSIIEKTEFITLFLQSKEL